jgi:hypothetical protein
MRSRRFWVVYLLLLGLINQTSLAAANHSVPSPREYWDGNGNGRPDADWVRFRVGGNGWYDEARSRVLDAETNWRNNTLFDIQSENVQNNYIILYSTSTRCGGWSANVLAVTCRSELGPYTGPEGTYYKLTDVDIYFNTSYYTFWTGPLPDYRYWDFYGVLMHELGHGVRLFDLDDAFCTSTDQYGNTPPLHAYTMCGAAMTTRGSYRWRSLETDDINGANSVYDSE